MSSTVDNRVVELGFNNKEFESGTKQSLKSIEAMKKGLNFDDSAKSIGNLSRASKGFSLSSMAESVQGVSNRFSTLGIVGFTIIQNLTNAAIKYGQRMIQGFMKPMQEGFQEYETQMNAIQTVLANTESKGTTLKDVSAALDELNTYADKTIYNFTEMTRNIGTFTAAGVDLDTSTQAIKGIANLAAVSGSNSQQASTAMYQLSQALSSGTVKLMDWNSVVNAGMGGQVFQDALKETARVSGIAIDDLIDKHGSFRETLQTGWLSSEVLLDTLQKFTGDLTAEQLKTIGYTEDQIKSILKLGQTANDAATKVKTFTQLKETLQEAIQSGWTKSWEIVIGDFEEAKELFTEISDTLGALIGDSADARNNLLQDWKDAGGRGVLISSLRNAFQALLLVMAPIKEAFREIFPPITGEQLARLTDLLWKFTRSLKINSEQADQIKRIFKGVFSIFKFGIDIVSGLANVIFTLFSDNVSIDGGGLLEGLAQIGDFFTNFRKDANLGEFFSDMLEFMSLSIIDFRENMEGFVTSVSEGFTTFKETIKDAFSDIDTSGITDFFDKIDLKFKPFETLLKGLAFIIGGILKAAGLIIPSLAKVGLVLYDFIKRIGTSISEAITNLDFTEIFSAINTGLFAAILLAIRNFITSGGGALEEVGGMFEGIKDVLDGVRGSLEAWQQNLKSKTLLNIAIAVGILAASLIAISQIDTDKLGIAMGVITGMFLQLIAAQAGYSKVGGGGLGSVSLIPLATSLLIMAGAISILAKLDKQKMLDGLEVIVTLLASMLIFSKFMSGNTGGLISGGLGMIAVATSMLVLAKVVERLGEIDPEVLKTGLLAVGAMLAEIAVFMRIVDDKGVVKGLGLLAMAGAVVILSTAVEKMGMMDLEVLQKGLASLAAVLASIAIFTRVSGNGANLVATSVGVVILSYALEQIVKVIKQLGNMDPEKLALGLGGMAVALLVIAASMRAMPKNMVLQAASLYIVAEALKTIAGAIEDLGGMTWEEIAKGLVTLGGAMLIIAVGLYAMSGTLAGSIALIIAAGALSVLANVMAQLGSMPLTEIGIALLALVGIFTVLGVAGLLLTPLVPTLLGLGAAMFLIGAGAALVGAGLLAFSTGLLALAAGGAAAAVGIVAFVTTLLGLVPVVIKTLIDAMILFAKGIIKAAPLIFEAITTVMLGFLQVIIDTAPKIFETLGVLLDGLVELIVEHIPDFIAAVVLLLLTLLEEIAMKMPDFIQAGFDILISFLEGIRDNIAEVVTVVVEIVTEFIGAVADNLPDIIQSGWDLIIAFIDGMADGIDKNMQPALDALDRLATAMIDGLIAGLSTGASRFIETLKQLARDAIAAAFKIFDSNSPSKVMASLGETIPEGLVVGVTKFGYKVLSAVRNLGNDTIDTMKSTFNNLADLASNEVDINPVITPVVDMSNVTASNRTLDEIFGTKNLNLNPALATASSISRGLSVQGDIPDSIINEGTKIEYVQNNYSPKALSRSEIRRQTRLQLLAVNGVLES